MSAHFPMSPFAPSAHLPWHPFAPVPMYFTVLTQIKTVMFLPLGNATKVVRVPLCIVVGLPHIKSYILSYHTFYQDFCCFRVSAFSRLVLFPYVIKISAISTIYRHFLFSYFTRISFIFDAETQC